MENDLTAPHQLTKTELREAKAKKKSFLTKNEMKFI